MGKHSKKKIDIKKENNNKNRKNKKNNTNNQQFEQNLY